MNIYCNIKKHILLVLRSVCFYWLTLLNLKQMKTEVITLLVITSDENNTKLYRRKTINIFLRPNKKQWKLQIFRREAYANYPHMRVVFILFASWDYKTSSVSGYRKFNVFTKMIHRNFLLWFSYSLYFYPPIVPPFSWLISNTLRIIQIFWKNQGFFSPLFFLFFPPVR